MKILVTGAAGFIGSSVMGRLAGAGHEVTGIDNLNGYYDPGLKAERLEREGLMPGNGEPVRSHRYECLEFRRLDVTDRGALDRLFDEGRFDAVVHMAAQAGVRYSMENPHSYGEVNLLGFINVLEGSRHHGCSLVYASSSSVYGCGENLPFREEVVSDRPLSLYAATKRSNELMAAAYSHLYGLKAVGLRFFTVYGPQGRPDMVPLIFAESILRGEPLRLFDRGRGLRDFTHIDDIAEAVSLVTLNRERGRHDIYNVGYGAPMTVLRFAEMLERHLGKRVGRIFLESQPGDLPRTWADTTRLREDFGFTPRIDPERGVADFAGWVKKTCRPEGAGTRSK